MQTEDLKTINRSQKLQLQASCSLLIYSVVIFPHHSVPWILQWNKPAEKHLSQVLFISLRELPDPFLNKDILLGSFFGFYLCLKGYNIPTA